MKNSKNHLNYSAILRIKRSQLSGSPKHIKSGKLVIIPKSHRKSVDLSPLRGYLLP